jgi:hypothetical protein
MADKADQALKLAQKVEKDLKALEKHLMDQINKGFKELTDLHNAQEKRFTELHNEQDKRHTELHNEQDKHFIELHNEQAEKINEVVAWAQKTFDTKGWF